MNSVKFLPYVGSSYYNNAFGKKIMILGESHYGTVSSPNITQDVINAYLDVTLEREGWMNTYTKFERSLVNKETTREDSKVIWNSLLFYNYLQVLLTGPRESGTSKNYEDSETAFFEVLNEYKPDIIIAWGKRLYGVLPDTNWTDERAINIDGYDIENGYYTINDNHKVKMFYVYHPSTGYDWSYWHKVISHFIDFGISDISINEVGCQNFRKFKSLPSMRLGGVNIIVGANNAGKSTFDKLTVLTLDFLKKWTSGNGITINFTSPLCRQELGILNYEEAYSYFANEGEPMVLSMTIGRYQYKVSFPACKSKTADNEYTTSISASSICIVDLKDNNSKYTFDYTKSENDVVATAELPLVSPSTHPLESIERFMGSRMCSLDDDTKELISSQIDVITPAIQQLNFTNETAHILKSFDIIDEHIGTDVPNDIMMSYKALQSITRQVFDSKEEITVEMALPRKATLNDFVSKLKSVNEIQQVVDESRSNNVGIRNSEYIHIIELSLHKTFSIYNNDRLSKIICEYANAPRMQRVHKYFVCKWLEEFKIGTDIHFNNFEGEVYSCLIDTLDGHTVHLTTMGSGSVHMVALILNVASYIMKSGNMDLRTILVDEPEINLHPNWQSRLADFFLNVYEQFGVQVIVETHSEYLVRRSQVLVAKKHYTADDFDQQCIFELYYFPENGEPYSMGYMEDGYFENKFGDGFFNAATTDMLELSKISRD